MIRPPSAAQPYTFVTALTAAGQVLIGTTVGATLANLGAAVNDTDGHNRTTVASALNTYDVTAANTSATATTPVGSTLTLTAISPVAATGDAVALTATGTAFTAPGGGLLTGGVNWGTGTATVTNTLLSAAGANPGANAQATLGLVTAAIASVAALRGSIGANINRLQSATNVESVQVQNLTAAEDSIVAANIPQQVTNLSEYSILNQSGISALAQANSAQQSILKLLQ